MNNINGVEIFAVGTWNGDVYTDKDLDTLVQAFEETKEITKPYLKIGHGSKQTLLAKDELPAAGFIDRVYRIGEKLVADFVNIPAKIYELIKNKAYNKVSSEIFVNFRSNGKTYPYALKAVALLGAETPGVHTLQDILDLYADQTLPIVSFDQQSDSVQAFEMIMETDVNHNTEEDTMTLDELTRQNAKLESQVKSFETEIAELEKENKTLEANLKTTQMQAKEYKDKSELLDKTIKENAKKAFENEVELEVKGYADAGKIVPAQAPFLIALLKNVSLNEETKKFSIADKEYSDVKSLIKGFLDAHVDIKVDEKAETEFVEGTESDDKFISKVNKYAQENKVSFKDAYIALAPKNRSKDEE